MILLLYKGLDEECTGQFLTQRESAVDASR